MKNIFKFLSIVLIFGFLAIACTFGNGENRDVETEIGKLPEAINLPYEPVAVVWKTNNAKYSQNSEREIFPAPDWFIHAVIKFKPEDTKKILSDTDKFEARKTKIKWENWFPKELEKDAGFDDEYKSKVLEGTNADAEKFYKGNLKYGRLVRIGETDYFELFLHTV